MTAADGKSASRILFLVTLLTGSFLLFLIQPMVARMALPRLGGAPAVWNSAMLVYQALLLGGYAYAHALTRLPPRRQAMAHLALFALASLWLPLGLTAALPDPSVSPLVWTPWLLLSSIGPLFFVVAAQAPLMQRWFAATSDADPYPLYAASNLGSFAGLISYPLLVEPGFALGGQSLLWSALFIGLVFLVAACGAMLPRREAHAAKAERTPAPTLATYARWVLLAAVPSGLMLSTTTHLTTDIVAVPLLWVLPLGLYLLSFTVAFAANRTAADIVILTTPLIILSAGGLAFADASRHPAFWAAGGLILLFVVTVALHSQMYRSRPAADHLTGFYLAMSVGGVLGGLFCALVAPLLFDWTYEHPLLILAAAALIAQQAPLAWLERAWAGRNSALGEILLLAIVALLGAFAVGLIEAPKRVEQAGLIGLALAAVAAIGRRRAYLAALLALMLGFGGWRMLQSNQYRERSYFGVYGVATREGGSQRVLMHGTTLHGLQLLAPERARIPTTYYAPRSGVGLALARMPADAEVGIVGLGAGTLACYRQPGQRWTFFEIDPAIARIARDPARFTFIRNCAPDARIALGDARLTLAGEPARRLDALVLDAFSSDAVPMHLLTREAFAGYRRALAPGGLLLVHISNRYLDLEPLMHAIAREGGWTARVRDHQPTREETRDEATRSVWVAMAQRPETLEALVEGSGEDWSEPGRKAGFAAWSDDYATILPLISVGN